MVSPSKYLADRSQANAIEGERMWRNGVAARTQS